jgi:threonine dehydrogenase-like Zn-dependent dehydrogenase
MTPGDTGLCQHPRECHAGNPGAVAAGHDPQAVDDAEDALVVDGRQVEGAAAGLAVRSAGSAELSGQQPACERAVYLVPDPRRWPVTLWRRPRGQASRSATALWGFTPFLEGHGGLGTYAYGQEDTIRPVPGPFTDEEAAGVLIAFKTAHHRLVDRTPLAAGETLLILGGAGSSGSAAIQLGKALGATVIAAVGTPEKLAFCKATGADHVVNY